MKILLVVVLAFTCSTWLCFCVRRVTEEWMLMLGCAIGYWQGDVKKLVDDISALKPAFFCGMCWDSNWSRG